MLDLTPLFKKYNHARAPMNLQPDQDLLHYRLRQKIGEGGMGVVWQARDTNLDRDVAIKILPEGIGAEPERLARFEREAKLLAVLDHPNIAAVYGLHEADGQRFIAMEFVPGEDLAQRLARGPLPIEDALDIGRQVAAALEAAHEQGVIHRDLKPANIKCTPDGKVKVLDLGLAKALVQETSGEGASVSMSPTMTSAGTIAGTLLGTAAYMSPEQAKGKAVDRRADIWAFGVVLHEMLTGRKMFETETISETLAAVLRDEVSFDGLPPKIPAPVTALLKRCLDRDPRTRLRDIGEARIALAPESLAGAATTPVVEAAAGSPKNLTRERTLWAAGLALLAVVAVAGWVLAPGDTTPAPAEEIRSSIVAPEDHRFGGSSPSALSVSPDGKKMTFAASTGSGRPSLYLRTLGATEARKLSGTEGATYPFWSPDSERLAFFVDGKLKKLDLDGGAPLTITNATDARGGTWNADGTILFAPETQVGIHRVSDGGSGREPVTQLDPLREGETTHRFPQFLPDGHHYLYLRASHSAAPTDPVNSIWIGDLESDEAVQLMESPTHATYAQGHLFWVRERFLMARPFSPDRLEFTGEAFVVGEGVVLSQGAWRAAFSVSEAGPIVFHGGSAEAQALNVFDREGKVIGAIGEPANYSYLRLSPDDRFLAATVADANSGRADLWVYDMERNVGSRLTFDDAQDTNPVWSPDGKRIAFTSNRDGKSGVYVRAADGTGDAELLFSGEGRSEPWAWSPDGNYIAFNYGVGKFDIWILPLDGGDAYPFMATDFDEGYCRFSPDGRWLAYLSNESGRYDLYLTRFPGGDGKWQISKNGSDWLVGWNAAGDEVYFLDDDGDVAVIGVTLGDQVVVETPGKLFPVRLDLSWANASDGQSFILGAANNLSSENPVTLVLNWERGED
jgi:Tol biopolymer transport system component